MPIATRTFRVFVSSTFEDLKGERDALQHDVFPKLRTLCEQHGARFQAIDLRWGVRDEAALDQQTMEICLREIQRCKATGVRPNFIALLGDRYGWQPLPFRIPATEFDALKPHIPAGDAVAQVYQWYRLDENAVPPEYCLQPRTGEFVEPSAWSSVEQSLLQALAIAARAAGLSQTELIKYEASATHQEILAGLGDSEQDRQHVFGFVRRPFGNTDPRLDALKSHLRVHEFDAGDMTALSALVVAQLSEVIEREVKRFEDRPTLDLEIEAHDRFADDRCRIFIGRQSALDIIADYIGGTERRPLLLHGESGSGKSAVMAKASQQYNGPGRMIRRFIGASPESASGHALLTSLCRQIAPGETPVDYAQLENAFRERLSVATAEQPLVLFIDALDQLAASDPARDVTWLPSQLPPHVKVIVSTTADAERLPEGVLVRLERMAHSEGEQALDELLRDARRTLQPWQRETVLAHFERCGLPLYLKLEAEESRLWKSYTPENACTLGEGVAGVIDTLFDRLATNANHGPTLVECSLGYLAAARYGLTEDEVLDLLTADDVVWNDFDHRKHHDVSDRYLPVVVWSRLSLDLEPYLTEHAAPGATVMRFYHRALAHRAAARFLAGGEARRKHADLAVYFGGQTLGPRQVAELPWQLAEAAEWKELFALLARTQFFVAAWDASQYDLKGYWRQVEANSPLRMPEAYWPILDSDGEEEWRLAMVARLVGLFRDTGRLDIAKRCCRKLLWLLRNEAADSAGFMLAPIYLDLAHLEFVSDNREAGERWLARAHAIPLAVRDQADVLKSLFEAGLQAKRRGHWSRAKKLYQEAIDLAVLLDERKMLARLYNNIGNVEKNENSLDAAARHLRLGSGLARAERDPETESRCLNGLGDVARMQGDLPAAERFYGAALEIKTRLGDRFGMAKCFLALGNVALSRGGIEQAQPHYDRALEFAPADKELQLVVCENTARALAATRPPGELVAGDIEALQWQCYRLRRELGLDIPDYLRDLFGIYVDHERDEDGKG